MDAWGVDVIGSGSQKGYMMPPGLAFVAMSERAWAAHQQSDLPKFYLDLGKYRKSAHADSNPFTPAINLYFALEAALEMMQKEGLEAIFARHGRHRAAAQAGMKAIGLPLYAAEGYGSPAIIAVAPQGIDAEAMRKAVKERFDILLAGGQDHTQGQGVSHRPLGLRLRSRRAHRRGGDRGHPAGPRPPPGHPGRWRGRLCRCTGQLTRAGKVCRSA